MHGFRVRRLLGTCCVLLTVAGCAAAGAAPDTHSSTSPRSEPTPTAVASAPARGGRAAAIDVLEKLAVKGRAPLTGYDRAEFGQAWLDANRNGCDTRNDVLARDLVDLTYRVNTRDCVVEAGELADPYTAKTVHFVRGDGNLVDIDHVVSLGNAWVTGAFSWPIKERAALANDPMNLLAVDASANRQKGDGDTATWLPSNKAFRCDYVARQVSVKAKYGLWVTAPEHSAMQRVLGTCPRRPVVKDSGAPILVSLDVAEPGSGAPSSSGGAPSGPAPVGPVSYGSCDEVRAAGAAPIHVGDPGYSRSLDRDGDGTGCE